MSEALNSRVAYEEPYVTLYCGHALEILRAMPSESVDMVMTSPPYWGLRAYRTQPQIWDGDNDCEHEWGAELVKPAAHKAGETNPGKEGYTKNKGAWSDRQGSFCLKCRAWRGELGLEPTIELYISHLMQIFDEVKRILKPTGTCWVNIDDTYAGSNCGYGDYRSKNKQSLSIPEIYGDVKKPQAHINLPAKSLCLIPSRFALAMVERGWILRNDVVWHKLNAMSESVKDRFTTSWEHLFLFVKNRRYFFEQQFEPYTEPLNRWGGPVIRRSSHKYIDSFEQTGDNGGLGRLGATSMFREGRPVRPNELGRNKRDVWQINTKPWDYEFCSKCGTLFTGRRRRAIEHVVINGKTKSKCPVCGSTDDWVAHFASFAEKLCETPILAGCPPYICKKCGKAREKVYEVVGKEITDAMRIAGCDKYGGYKGKDTADYKAALAQSPSDSKRRILESMSEVKSFHYTDCGCGANFEPGVVLDPFCGSGTALAVAKKLGRKAIGIELNPDYCKLATERIRNVPVGMEL
jgi:DNA modification methylase